MQLLLLGVAPGFLVRRFSPTNRAHGHSWVSGRHTLEPKRLHDLPHTTTCWRSSSGGTYDHRNKRTRRQARHAQHYFRKLSWLHGRVCRHRHCCHRDTPELRTSPHKHIQALFLPVRRKIFFFLSILNFFILRKKNKHTYSTLSFPQRFSFTDSHTRHTKTLASNETQPSKLKLRFIEKKRKNKI